MKLQIVDHMLYPDKTEYLAYCEVCGKYEGDPGANEIFHLEISKNLELTVCTCCKENLIKTMSEPPSSGKKIVEC